MNVNTAEYMAAMDDIMGTMAAHGVDEQSRNEVLATIYGLKDEIVHA